MTRMLLSILSLLTLQEAVAQQFSITKLERIAGTFVLHYDLRDTVLSRVYTINLYSSSDNFITPLERATGDIGLEVKPGGNRRITWNAREELGAQFSGNVRLEVRGKVYIPFVKLDGFDDYKTFKKNRDYTISWTGGRGSSVLNFDLYRDDRKVASYPNIANVGYHNLRFENVKPGKGYVLKISDSRNKDEVVYSGAFKIRRKVPLMLKVIPLGIAGYMGATLVGGSGGDEYIGDPPLPGE